MEPVELSMLEVISKYGVISQRDISDYVGVSLGMVNLLIQKFVKIGLIKIEHLNGKKVKYILTPKGISVLSKKTFEYISRSYTAILQIKSHMNDIIENHYDHDEEILIYGAQDEIYLVLIELLKSKNRKFKRVDHIHAGQKVLHWDDGLMDVGVFLLGRF